jgi:hypothetical protein
MSVLVKINKLKQWKNPRKYRTVVAYGPKGIYQIDIMHLYAVWNKLFNINRKLQYGLYDYAVVCVDVYSRYVKARSIPNRARESIAIVIFHLITIMGKPNIISADNEIIDAVYKDGTLYIVFDGIQLYRTSPHELNKNAIVEQMIKTVKQHLINVFITYKTEDLISYYETSS